MSTQYYSEEKTLETLSSELAEYHRRKHRSSWQENSDFINDLEEKVCHFFLQIEEGGNEVVPHSPEYRSQQRLLYALVFLLEAIEEAAKQLYEERSSGNRLAEKKSAAIEAKRKEFNRRPFYFVEHENKLKIFKPDHCSKNFFVAIGLGIPNGDKVLERSMAAYYVSQLLGLNLVPPTTITFHDGKRGILQDFVEGDFFYEKKVVDLFEIEKKAIINKSTLHKVRHQIAQEIIGGPQFSESYHLIASFPFTREIAGGLILKYQVPISLEKAKVFLMTGRIILGREEVFAALQLDLSQPDFQKAMIDAQVFDFIIGQIDRSDGNFIITKKNKITSSSDNKSSDNKYLFKPPIQLIDHEFCFPPKFRGFDQKVLELFAQWEILTELPPLIDATTAEKIVSLNIEELTNNLLKIGLFLEEVEACIIRLEIIKNHIHQLKKEKKEKSDGISKIVTLWNKETYKVLIKEHRDATGKPIFNNYIVRNIANAQQKNAMIALLRENKEKLADLKPPPQFAIANRVLFWSRFAS
ncbi:MAG: hypothetical protein K2W99_01830 [Chthoniobacterales bacterium]|nr:hypothetical protein [Chthoniobacterales bacterium]